MALTLKWWTDAKATAANKVHVKDSKGKVKEKPVPETEFEKKLVIYDKARKTLATAETADNCQKALTALAAVETVRKSSKTALEDQEFKKLAALLTPSVTSNEETALKSVQEQIILTQMQALAHNPEEAVYDTLWHAYDKQRDKEKNEPTKTLYASMLASLIKLESQAVKCHDSDVHLAPKYKRQSALLALEKTRITQAQTHYNAAIQQAIHARQVLLPSFNQLTPTLTQAEQTLTNVKVQALAAQQAKNSFALNKLVKDANAAATPALAQWDLVSATFAPTNPIRTSADLNGIAREDSQNLILPHFDALNQVNKANLAHKRNIETLLADIAAIKVSA